MEAVGIDVVATAEAAGLSVELPAEDHPAGPAFCSSIERATCHVCQTESMTSDLIINGAREHNLKDISLQPAARPLHRHHRPLGLGQVVARLRHHLRRGPAPLRREPLRLRAPVPRPDGQAGRRQHRGSVAGHLHRPEDHLPQPALHRRHGHRDLRLPAPALRPRRAPALPAAAGGPSPGRACSRSSTRCASSSRARASA